MAGRIAIRADLLSKSAYRCYQYSNTPTKNNPDASAVRACQRLRRPPLRPPILRAAAPVDGAVSVACARRPITPFIVKDSLAQIAPAEIAIGPPNATARRLVDASVSANTRRAYAGVLGQRDAWLDGQKLDDAALAAYLRTCEVYQVLRLEHTLTPDLHYQTVKGALLLSPSPPRIAPSQLRLVDAG